MSNNTIITIFMLSGFGLAGYFIYENYMKKQGVPTPLNNTGVFQQAENTVSNFLSQLSGGLPSNLLNNSGGLSAQGISQANKVLSNPLEFNDLMMQSQLNNNLSGTGLGSGNNNLSSSNSLLVPYPGVTPGINPVFGIGMLT